VITDSGTSLSELYAPADDSLHARSGREGGATDSAVETASDAFCRSRVQLGRIVDWLGADDAHGLAHSQLEYRLDSHGRELLRMLLQDHLDLRAGREQRLTRVADEHGVQRRAVEVDHRRALGSVFGEVSVGWLAYRQRGEHNRYVSDGVLNLPAEHASHAVRRLAAFASTAGCFEHATGQLRDRTCLQLGKRHVEQLAVRAAVDFDSFYAEQTVSDRPPDENDVLVLSADGKGIVMRADALRDAAGPSRETQVVVRQRHPGRRDRDRPDLRAGRTSRSLPPADVGRVGRR
jgi:hypothetical protein